MVVVVEGVGNKVKLMGRSASPGKKKPSCGENLCCGCGCEKKRKRTMFIILQVDNLRARLRVKIARFTDG